MIIIRFFIYNYIIYTCIPHFFNKCLTVKYMYQLWNENMLLQLFMFNITLNNDNWSFLLTFTHQGIYWELECVLSEMSQGP